MNLHTSSLGTELPKLLEKLKTEFSAGQKLIKDELEITRSAASDLSSSQQFLSDKFDEILRHVKELRSEITVLRNENASLKQSLTHLSAGTKTVADAVDRAERELDNQVRTKLSANAIILGIPRQPQENIDEIVARTCESLGYKTANADISSCTRISNGNSTSHPIRVMFKTPRCKEMLMAHKKARGPFNVSSINGVDWTYGANNKVTIRDELSPLSLRLFHELKTLQTTLKLRFVWPGKNGAIMVKQDEKSRAVAVYSRQDVERLVRSSHPQ